MKKKKIKKIILDEAKQKELLSGLRQWEKESRRNEQIQADLALLALQDELRLIRFEKWLRKQDPGYYN